MLFHAFLLMNLLSFGGALPGKDTLLTKLDVLTGELNTLQGELNDYLIEKDNRDEIIEKDSRDEIIEKVQQDEQEIQSDPSALPAETCGFETDCADSFKQDSSSKKKWTKHMSSKVLLDHTDPRGTSMVASFVKGDSKKDYATLTYEFTIKASSQCGEISYYMYNKEGCDVARFLVTLECGSEKHEVLRESGSMDDFWQRVLFDINHKVGTKCKMTFRASKGLSESGKVYFDDVTMYFQECPKKDQPDLAAHALCRFDSKTECDWSTSGDLEWEYTSHGTKSKDTGPSRYLGFYSNDGQGTYAYIDASSSNSPSKTAILTSPQYSSPTQQCMRFFANMYGKDTGKLEAYLETSAGKKKVLRKEGDQGKEWFEGRIQLPSNTPYNVELKATTGNGEKSDIAIDEIKVEEGTCQQKSLTLCDYDDKKTCLYRNDDCSNEAPSLGPKYEKLEQHKLEKNKVLTTLPRLNEEWKLSVEVFLRNKPRGWGSVIHFTTGSNCCGKGSRVPAIFVKPGTSKLHICAPINWGYNTCIDSKDIPLNKWVKVEFQHLKVEGRFEYDVKVDGVAVSDTKLNHKPQTFTNVKVYAGDPWHNAADGDIKNLKFENVGAVSQPCQSKCQGFVEDVTIDGKQTKSITYDMLFCENQKFENEITIAANTIRAPRQGCFRLNYKFGKSRNSVTSCHINFYHRRMNGNHQKHFRPLLNLKEGGSNNEWKTFSMNFFDYDEQQENRFGFKFQLHHSCSYISFANMEILDGPCID